MSGRRVALGGRIDRSRPLSFSFDGRRYEGCAGDTLASALLAAGVSVVGRSFKRHRPTGLLAAGVEEPNALVQLGVGAHTEPNLRATEVELIGGLSARSVNAWPSARFDLGAGLGLLGRFIPAGFYYKTFMWPSWRLFEPSIRRAAGLGRAPGQADPDTYDHRHAHCDVLVVGGGPAGLAAARAASAGGADVILAEQNLEFGGALAWEPAEIDGQPADTWVAATLAALGASNRVRLLPRTTALGYFDHNLVALAERHAQPVRPGAPRQRLWQVRAQRVILACGAFERPLLFRGNGRPGVMLASAVRRYLGEYGVLAGGRAVIVTNNDSAYACATALQDAGGKVCAVVDMRPRPPQTLVDTVRALGIPIFTGGRVVDTRGRPALSEVVVSDAQGSVSRIAADLLAMSGGWDPATHLERQAGAGLTWDAEQGHFRPGPPAQSEVSAGACNGALTLASTLREGHAAGVAARGALRLSSGLPDAPVGVSRECAGGAAPSVEAVDPKAYVDFQNDVTVADVDLAARENFRSVEHLKRYTTLGMGADQGKTSNVNGLAVLAAVTARPVPDVGSTKHRFPFTPLAFGLLAGRARGELARPLRRLPAHQRHVTAGAAFEEYAGWARAAYYPLPGESAWAAEQREALSVRTGVGLFDSSSLGKIEVVGPDAGEFLDRVYANGMSSLKVGRARHGLMLNELGVIIDDGVTVRLAQDRFLVGTTSGGADTIAQWLEEWRQCEWPDLRVIVAPVTTSWAVLTLSGPRARDVLIAAGVGADVSREALPHMGFLETQVAGLPARIARVSFTGELTFEIAVASSQADRLWDSLQAAGAPHCLTPVGIDAWMVLRTEKGFLHVGVDTDGTTSPLDVGWGHVLKRRKDFIGRRSLTRPNDQHADRLQFVGLRALDPLVVLPVGSHVRGEDGSVGYVTSTAFSPHLRQGVALGMVRGGRGRLGEVVEIVGPRSNLRAAIVAPGAYDPEGTRLND